MSDVPLGAYLSGGLDSSAIVAEMSPKSKKPVKTFTIGFDEKDYNEFKYAKQVSSKYKTDHKEITISSKKYLETIKTLIKFKDAPLGVPNEVPLYLMSKELKKHITVVLSGEGADEIFSGYGRIYRSVDDYKKMRFLNRFPILKCVYPFSNMEKNLLLKYETLKTGLINEKEYNKVINPKKMIYPS